MPGDHSYLPFGFRAATFKNRVVFVAHLREVVMRYQVGDVHLKHKLFVFGGHRFQRGRRLADVSSAVLWRTVRYARWDAGLIPFRRPFPACPVVSAFYPFGPAFG